LDIRKNSLLKEWSGIGPGCPGQWWSPHPWMGSKTVWMWHFRHGGVGVTVGLHDLEVFSNLHDSLILGFYECKLQDGEGPGWPLQPRAGASPAPCSRPCPCESQHSTSSVSFLMLNPQGEYQNWS